MVPLREYRDGKFAIFFSSVAFCVYNGKAVYNCVVSGFADASLIEKVCRVGAACLLVDMEATMILDSLELKWLASRTLFGRFADHFALWAERVMRDAARIEV